MDNRISGNNNREMDLKFADFQCDSRKKFQNGEKDVDVKQKIDQQFKDWKSAGHAGMWIKKGSQRS